MSGSSSVALLGHRERAALLAALALAMLLVWNAGEPWIAREPDFTRRFPGTDYVQGMIALAAGLALAAVCIGRLINLASRTTTIVTGFVASAVALAMPLSLWVSLVGGRDPNVDHPIRSRLLYPDAEFMGTAELWTAVLLATAALAIFAALAFSLRRGVGERPGDVRAYPVAFALLAVIAPFAMWSAGTSWTRLGAEHTAGLIALVAAINGLLVAMLLWRDDASQRTLAIWGLAAGAVMLAAPVWFYLSTIGEPDIAYFNTTIDCFGPCDWIDAGAGLPLSIIAAAGYFASVAIAMFADALPLRRRVQPPLLRSN